MISDYPFQTRARTIDHLGREQIADAPTSVSELWKNAYDAYARNVELNIYDGEVPVAVISDDGHGMNVSEIIDKWLVVGTDNKLGGALTPVKDRNGLPKRERLGQKGIGRLSCGSLGAITLLVSKRKEDPFVAALVDWRIFENPLLLLDDVRVPVVEAEDLKSILQQVPSMVKELQRNVTGVGASKERRARIEAAWSVNDELLNSQTSKNDRNSLRTTSNAIVESLAKFVVLERHFNEWPVCSEKSKCGTAILISDLCYDLRSYVDRSEQDTASDKARERFEETLVSFVDPFVDPTDQNQAKRAPDFYYAARYWEGEKSNLIVGSDKQIQWSDVNTMEHQLRGQFDSNGTFRGQVKAFGQWVTREFVLDPPSNLKIPKRSDARVGPFRLFIASFEFDLKNTSHDDQQFSHLTELATNYAGFLMFRDGLRVLPFGRSDNDFFEIDERRSKNAGREFWNHRQMFGRIALARQTNPNLKDKAGREGLQDNQAAKVFKRLVMHVLMEAARKYFGSASSIRKEELPGIREANAQKRESESRAKLEARYRKQFRKDVRDASAALPDLAAEIQDFRESLQLKSYKSIETAIVKMLEYEDTLETFVPREPPADFGGEERKYLEVKADLSAIRRGLSDLSKLVEQAEAKLQPGESDELLKKRIETRNRQHMGRIREWSDRIRTLQRDEAVRVRALIEEHQLLFKKEAGSILERFSVGQLEYLVALKEIDGTYAEVKRKSEELFLPYIRALESLQESIDLESVATFSASRLEGLQTEVTRLNALAQLGIAVEIVGHELRAFESMIEKGIAELPANARKSKAVEDIQLGSDGLADKLQYLSPLRLAGTPKFEWITGERIYSYVRDFFEPIWVRDSVEFSATKEFSEFKVYEQQARLMPIFINLVNNSLYWLRFSKSAKKQIILDVVDGGVVVSDNGPGVAPEDIDHLFTLFFTRKVRGGRGVGLYLCKANLATGGHKIRYVSDPKKLPLKGANFVIEFHDTEEND